MPPTPSPQNSKPSSGFTLVELLVAMAAIALISAFTWRGVDAIADTSERARSRSESLLLISRAIEVLRDDLDQLACNNPSSTAPAFKADSGTNLSDTGSNYSDASNELSIPYSIEFGAPLPTAFAIWTRQLDPPEPRGIQVVAWFTQLQPSGSKRLVRWASKPLTSPAEWLAAIDAARRIREKANPELQNGSSIQGFDAAESIEFNTTLSQGLWKAGARGLDCPASIPGSTLQDLGLQATLSPSIDMSGPVRFVWASPLITGSKP
jgi:prepilin-type N-terminal cleavage/methylation domain-containing protein